jgi:hypothetical protein
VQTIGVSIVAKHEREGPAEQWVHLTMQQLHRKAGAWQHSQCSQDQREKAVVHLLALRHELRCTCRCLRGADDGT